MLVIVVVVIVVVTERKKESLVCMMDMKIGNPTTCGQGTYSKSMCT